MLQVLIVSLAGGLLSLVGGLILIRNKNTADGLAKYATPFAAGVLLAAAFTDLLPEAMHGQEPDGILLATLIGLLGFFMLERFLHFFHHHHEHKGATKTSSPLIIIGDTLHNALDGVAIGAAFLISPSVGIVAAIAVAAHEIPQEIGDFGLLLRNGMQKTKVIWVNVVSALATVVTAVITFGFGDADSQVVPYLLAITAGFFIYIAASDIIPEIHEKLEGQQRDVRPWLLLLGAAFIMIVSPLAHGYIDAGHEHEDEHHSAGELHEYDEDDEHHDHDEKEHHDEEEQHAESEEHHDEEETHHLE